MRIRARSGRCRPRPVRGVSHGVRDCTLSCAVVVTVLCITSPVAAAFGWSTQTLPTSFGSPGGVSCSAPSACIAVGGFTGPARQGQSLAARWDGRRWFRQQTPDPAGGAGSLESVSCSSRTACVAVGSCDCSPAPQPLAERWDGREWSIQRIHYRVGAGTWLYAVSCSSASACTAVGSTGQKEGPSAVLVQRWDGRSWSAQSAPTPAGATGIFLVGVSCVTSTSCTAVGRSAYGPLGQVTRPLVERWDGRRWAIDRVPRSANSSSSQLESVSCTSSTGCTAVGNGPRGPLVERLNGNRWSIQPSPGGPPAQLSAVSCASATICMTVGAWAPGEMEPVPPPIEMLAERWNGRHWSLQHITTPEGGLLNSVACPSTRTCVAVGVNGSAVVERYS